jgi:hypothetical protein
MAEKRKSDQKPAEEIAIPQVKDLEDALDESGVLTLPLASAKNMSRPTTTLAVPPRGAVGELTVSIAGDARRAQDPDEGDMSSRAVEAHGRTPLMAVIEVLLARHGGSLRLSELTDLVGKHWNRPFPTSPYSNEEFIYVVVSSSDRVRVG